MVRCRQSYEVSAICNRDWHLNMPNRCISCVQWDGTIRGLPRRSFSEGGLPGEACAIDHGQSAGASLARRSVRRRCCSARARRVLARTTSRTSISAPSSSTALANPGSMNVSWPPRGPLSQKQRDAIASSGITAINVTVSADFEGSVRNIALWQGEADRYPDAAVDRPPPFGYRGGEAEQDAWPDARLPEHRHDRSRHLATRHVLPPRHPHHSAHLQRSQLRR